MNQRAFALLAAMLLSVLCPRPADAHSFKAALVQIDEVDAGALDVFVKVPAIEQRGFPHLEIEVAGCEAVGTAVELKYPDALGRREQLRCDSTADVRKLTVTGFGRAVGHAVVVYLSPAGRELTLGVGRYHPTVEIPVRGESVAPAPAEYFPLGVTHILGGVDHLLFLVGLLLVVWRRDEPGRQRWRTLVTTITAFTVAHSVTLASAALGAWRLPSAPVELLIAASILLLAVELARGQRGLTTRAPAAVAFAFGLVHGFGFAGALSETGLPERGAWLALLGFNLGVELGQVALVGLAVGATHVLKKPLSRMRERAPRLEQATIYALGTGAAFWCFERLGSLGGM